jgi:hypothetical protein
MLEISKKKEANYTAGKRVKLNYLLTILKYQRKLSMNFFIK